MLLLIHSHDGWDGPEEPDPPREPIDLKPALRFVHVIVAFVAALVLPGWPSVVLMLLSLWLLCRAVVSLIPYSVDGMREYRQ